MSNAQTAKFTVAAAQKVAQTVRDFNAVPRDEAAERRRSYSLDNRTFWVSFAGTGGNDTPGEIPIEVRPTQELDDDGTPTGVINWSTAVIGSNRGPSAGPYPMCSGLELQGVAPYTNAQLIRQDFDTTQSPAVPIYRPVSPLVLVGTCKDSGTTGLYNGSLGGYSESPNCDVVNLSLGNDNDTWGNISSPPTSDVEDDNGNGMVLGMVVGMSAANPGRTMVAASLEYASKLVWVNLTIDDGDNGQNSYVTTTTTSISGLTVVNSVTLHPPTDPTYTYTATTSSGPSGSGSYSGGGVQLGTALTPSVRPRGYVKTSSTGCGWIKGGVFVLWDSGERPSSP